jgi:hypothetical protein
MELAIVLSLAASLCTATASICQRIGARRLEHEGGLAAIFTNWSAYVLMVVGAAAMLLASHAVAAGPLAASQPGFTIGDPVTAVLLGVLVFGERLGASPAALATELLGLIVLAIGVWTLSGSWLIIGAESGRADCQPGESGERATQELIRRSP